MMERSVLRFDTVINARAAESQLQVLALAVRRHGSLVVLEGKCLPSGESFRHYDGLISLVDPQGIVHAGTTPVAILSDTTYSCTGAEALLTQEYWHQVGRFERAARLGP